MSVNFNLCESCLEKPLRADPEAHFKAVFDQLAADAGQDAGAIERRPAPLPQQCAPLQPRLRD